VNTYQEITLEIIELNTNLVSLIIVLVFAKNVYKYKILLLIIHSNIWIQTMNIIDDLN